MNRKSADPVDAKIAARVRLARIMAGMSQEQLGKRLGLTFQQVQKYEKGTNRISSGRMVKIAEALGQPVIFFYQDTLSSEPANGDCAAIVTRMLTMPYGIQLARSFCALPRHRQRSAVAALVQEMAEAGGRS